MLKTVSRHFRIDICKVSNTLGMIDTVEVRGNLYYKGQWYLSKMTD